MDVFEQIRLEAERCEFPVEDQKNPEIIPETNGFVGDIALAHKNNSDEVAGSADSAPKIDLIYNGGPVAKDAGKNFGNENEKQVSPEELTLDGARKAYAAANHDFLRQNKQSLFSRGFRKSGRADLWAETIDKIGIRLLETGKEINLENVRALLNDGGFISDESKIFYANLNKKGGEELNNFISLTIRLSESRRKYKKAKTELGLKLEKEKKEEVRAKYAPGKNEDELTDKEREKINFEVAAWRGEAVGKILIIDEYAKLEAAGIEAYPPEKKSRVKNVVWSAYRYWTKMPRAQRIIASSIILGGISAGGLSAGTAVLAGTIGLRTARAAIGTIAAQAGGKIYERGLSRWNKTGGKTYHEHLESELREKYERGKELKSLADLERVEQLYAREREIVKERMLKAGIGKAALMVVLAGASSITLQSAFSGELLEGGVSREDIHESGRVRNLHEPDSSENHPTTEYSANGTSEPITEARASTVSEVSPSSPDDLAVVKKGEGLWHVIKRQLTNRMEKDPESFAAKYGINPEKLSTEDGRINEINRVTANILRRSGHMSATGESWITRPGVVIKLNPDDTLSMPDAKTHVFWEKYQTENAGGGGDEINIDEESAARIPEEDYQADAPNEISLEEIKSRPETSVSKIHAPEREIIRENGIDGIKQNIRDIVRGYNKVNLNHDLSFVVEGRSILPTIHEIGFENPSAENLFGKIKVSGFLEAIPSEEQGLEFEARGISAIFSDPEDYGAREQITITRPLIVFVETLRKTMQENGVSAEDAKLIQTRDFIEKYGKDFWRAYDTIKESK